MASIASTDYKRGMRRLAAAVNIVSTLHEGRPAGLLATAVCSVSAEPPTLLVCVNRAARTFDAIRDTGRFCVNLLAETQGNLARQFLDRQGPDRFSICTWSTMETGSPAIDGALVNFDCEVTETVQAGTHTVFLGRVVAIAIRPDGAPLLYHDGAYAGLAGNAASEGSA